MSNLRDEEVTRASAHHPTVLSGGGSSWVVCRCGWQTRRMTTRQAASNEWALHLAFMVSELDVEPVRTVELDTP